jgi:hypothetical protein
MRSIADRLYGSWRTDPNDNWSLHEYGDVSLRFERDGQLIYTVHSSDREEIAILTYRIDGSWLIIDQPSSPREERREFFFTEDDRLAIKDGTSGITFYIQKDM